MLAVPACVPRRRPRPCRPTLEVLEDRTLPAGGITEFTIPTAGTGPVGITIGPDGNVWFTENAGHRVGRLTPQGVFTEFSVVTTPGNGVSGITAGPDGNLWITETFGNKILCMNTAGEYVEFPIPTANSQPQGITAGQDGNLWFAETQGDRISRITPAGAITEFPLLPGSHPWGIAAGPDGFLWFTEADGNQVGRINTAGTLTETFSIPTPASAPHGITPGPDGNLWFAESAGNQIGRITPAGVITQFSLPSAGSTPEGIVAGPDGALWFTEAGSHRLGRMSTDGGLTEYPGLAADSAPVGITAGPDGALWFAEQGGNRLGRAVPDRPLVAAGTAVSATAGAAFTAVVATFTDADPGSSAGEFGVTIHWGDGQASVGTVSGSGALGYAVVGSHAYAIAGTFAIQVTVTGLATARDVGGSTTGAQVLARVAAPVLPPLTISGPSRGVAGRVLVFDNSWGASSLASWRVTRRGGKGKVVARGVGPRFRFRPRDPGTYLLTLTATPPDAGAAQVASQLVQVRKKKGPPR